MLAIGVFVVVGVVQCGVRCYASGTLRFLPMKSAASTSAEDLVVLHATPAETTAIRSAVASLRYQLPAHALTFDIVDQPTCPKSESAYLPALGIIQVQRSVIDGGSPALFHAIAHEIGHYVDQHYLADSDRAEFMRMRGIPEGLTWLAPDQPWQARPSEDFPEVFAVLALSNVDSGPETSYGPVRDPGQYEQLLGASGIRFDGSSTTPDWGTAVLQEFSLLKYVTADATIRLLLETILVLLMLYAALPEMVDAWRA